MAKKKYQLIILTAIVVFYVGLSFYISEAAKFNNGPDEETNLAYIEFIINTGRLPINYEERALVGKDSNWPAMYHLLVAGISRLAGVTVDGPPTIKIFWDSFRYRAIDAGDSWYYLYAEDQLRPYFGRILVLHIGRWLSIFFGVINLILTYFVVRAALPHQPNQAVAGVGLLAFWPVYVFMSGVMNEDTLNAAFTTLYLWMLILAVKQSHRWWIFAMIGVALGLSVTVKYATIILPLEIPVVFALLAWHKNLPWRWWAGRVALVGFTTALSASWWFGWNFWYLNEVKERGWLAGLLRPIFTGGPDITLSRLGFLLSGGEIGLSTRPENRVAGSFAEWVRFTFYTFWSESAQDFVSLSPYTTLAVSLLLALTAVGLWRLWRANREARIWLLLLGFHVGIFFVLPLLRFSLSRRIGETAQGRHIFIPAAAAIIILLVWGVTGAIPRRWQIAAFAVIIVGFGGWSGAIAYRLGALTLPPVPLRTVPQAAGWYPVQLNARFDDLIELASYKITSQPVEGRLQVDLAWRSLAYTRESYLLDVALLDAGGSVVLRWQGYTGGGQVPTLAWDPGDVVFDRLTLPLFNAPAGDYQLSLQFLSPETNQPLGQTVTLPVQLAQPAGDPLAATPTAAADVAFTLWDSRRGPVTADMPVYRYPATIALTTTPVESVQLVDDGGQVWSPDYSQPDLHIFVIGPRWVSGSYRLQLVSANGQKITTVPALQIDNWWERKFEVPETIEVPLQLNLANQIEVLGYTLPQKQVKAGESFPVTLYWRALPGRSPEADFVQFNHLLDNNGNLSGGYDRIPLEYYSTLLWAPGEVVVDGYAVPVDAAAPPGKYWLDVGYYLIMGEAAVNLPIVKDNQPTDASSVIVGPIEVIN